MVRDQNKIIDWRSTGRRIARRTMYKAMVEYKCCDCGRTSKEPPKDAPKWFEDIWPVENRTLDAQLQADHVTKDLQNNELENLEWRCPSCHKLSDKQTEKGVSTKQVDFWGDSPQTKSDGETTDYW